MKSLIKPVAFLIAVILCGLATAANVNTVSSAATGSSLILLLKNSTDGNYFYSELTPTVSSLRTMSELQSDTPEQYSIIGDDVTGPLNESTFQGLNGYVAPNLQAYLAGNTGDVITWTIMASKSGPNANNGQAALVVTSNNDFLDTAPWINQDAWQSATLFEYFLNNEFNNATFTNGVSSTNGWGSSNAEGSNAPNSFNGGGYENGEALGTAQYVYLLGTTGGDAANVYKSSGKLNLSSTGVLSYSTSSPSSYTIGGSVTGLGAGKTLVLNNNGGDALTISANGSFTFATSIASGGAYAVTVATQPTGQTCLISNGSGSVTATVTTVNVSCTINSYTIGGSVTGLGAGKTLVLNNNGGDPLTISATGSFTFATSIATGGAYAVTVATPPTGQVCTLSNATGTVGISNVVNVIVTCTSTYTVSGTVSGLGVGKSVVLQNNGANSQTVTNPATGFSFPAQADGSGYNVTVLTQPVGQTCSLLNNSGTLAGANVTNVAVTCTDTTYTISGSITGLSASGLSLSLTGSKSGTVSPVSGATSYSFTQTVVNGNSYTVSIGAQPTGQTCTLSPSPATGTVGTSNIMVDVSCAVNAYTIAVTNSSGAAVSISGSTATNTTNPNSATSFNFSAKHGDAVVLSATKAGNTCPVTTTPASINPITGNATATVSCTLNTYTIAVTNSSGAAVSISGSTATNATNPNSATSFNFSAKYGDNVSLSATKAGNTCTVTPSSISAIAAGTSATVSCSTNTYTVSGTVSGLGSGKSVVLQNNGANSQTVTNPATGFSFPAQADGSVYNVTVLTQPVGQTCSLLNNSGTLAGANVTNVAVTCTDTTYTVSGSITGLSASGLSLSLSGTKSGTVSPVSGATSYSFTQTVVNGNSYTVSFGAQPTGQACTLSPSPATGTVGTSNIVVDVSCTVNAYTIAVTNSSGAAVSISGSTATNTTNPNSATSFNFSAKHGDAVVLSATKAGNTCPVTTTPASINPITGNAMATVSCTLNTYTVGGTNTDGANVTITNSSVTGQTATSATPYSFNAKYGDQVTLTATKTGYACSVAGSPITVGAANVMTANVTCSKNTYTISGTTDGTTVTASGSTVSNTVTTNAGSYSVSAKYGDVVTLTASKTGYSSCVIATSPITVNDNITANVSGCTLNTYTIAVTNSSAATVSISGSAATNNTNPNSATSFNVSAKHGDNVSLSATKTGNTCTVTPSSISAIATNTNATVSCSVNTYTVSGTVTGNTGAVTLTNNGGDTKTVASGGGSFSFTAQSYGSNYLVAVAASASQMCTVSNASGSNLVANITNVAVSCVTKTYTVSGTVIGNTGAVTLANNGGDSATVVVGGGTFTFSAQNYGTNYLVSTTSPTGQTCLVTNGSGSVTAAVTDVSVTCTTNTYTVGGLLSGLSGSVTLLNNGADPIVLNINRSFRFTTPILNGSSYNVTLAAQPVGQVCSVTNPTGTITGTSVTNIVVSCAFSGVQGSESGGGAMDKNVLLLLAALGFFKWRSTRAKPFLLN